MTAAEPRAAVLIKAFGRFWMSGIGETRRSVQGAENPRQEASALRLVAAVGLNWVKRSAREPIADAQVLAQLTAAAGEKRLMIEFRSLDSSDQSVLWGWLHIALWDPPPAGLRPREVLHDPGVRIYAEDWGRPGDVGVVAVVNGVDAGACWMRVLPEGVGLASIDDTTPQLGIALEPCYQHRGIGEPLMREALGRAWQAGHEKVSLTVHPENPAIPLYERCGFGKVEIRLGYHLMVATRP